jgi:hypothetical protein
MNRNTKDKPLQTVREKLQRRLLAIRNIRFARRMWEVSCDQATALQDLTTELQLSVAAGHLKLIESNWYVTHAGLLRIAQGIGLLEQFARDDRIRIRQPKRNMQKKIVRSLSNGNEFVAYVDAIGHLDGTRRLLEWKTTSARYPEEPEGLTSLDLQLVCYSWITGISDVAIVAFVRKRAPEIQYLLASITEEQRQEFGQLAEATARQIEAAQFPAHPGIRFPQNGCVSCAHLGLCLRNETLVGTKLIRQPGAADLDWLDMLDD